MIQEILIVYLNEYGGMALLASFLIGVLTSLAPCSIITLPLLAGSTVTLSDDLDEKEKKLFIYKYSALFVLGLIISFSVLMLIVAKIGMMLSVAPFWAYALAAISTFLVVVYSLGWFGSLDKQSVARKFLKYKLYGALVIGVIFGLVSSPCASALLVAIITTAEQSGWVYAYFLVLSFAMGHGSLLLLAGMSLGFAQSVISSKSLNVISKYINGFFIAVLIAIGIYFIYKAYQIF
jgi:cytochrome c biogenesis protein CcdA